jgi:hypothetical protein
MTIIVAYAPTDISDDEEKDLFYDQLCNATTAVPPHDQLFILGDFNASTGTDYNLSPSVIGRYGSGRVNDNSLRLLSFCASHGLSVMGSWFRRKDIWRWTWISNDHHTVKESDHILTSSRRVFRSYRVYRGAESPANTDHRLVVAEICLHVLPTSTSKPVRKFAVENLVVPATASAYRDRVEDRLRAVHDESMDVEGLWGHISTELRDCAIKTVGYTKAKPKQPWITPDILEVIRHKAAARLNGSVTERRTLCGRLRGMIKAARDAYYNRLADEAEVGLHNNNLRAAYRTINLISGRATSSVYPS